MVENTLPKFLEEHQDKINFIHFDMDIYEPTKIALSLMKSRLKKGCIILLAQCYNYSGWREGEFKALKDVEITRWIEFGNGINNNIETISKPTIAYINGYAMGGGLELALACDFRLASKNAILSTPEVSNGWLPGWGGMTRIRRLVGEANAKKIILLSQKMDANSALQIGLITKISTKEELHIFTNNLLEIKPQVYAMAKSALMDATRTTYGSDINFDVLAVKISS